MQPIETLPLETIWQIALKLDPTSLMNLCRTNKQYADLCRSDNFWKNYFDRHPEVPENVESPMFWARKAYHDFGFPIRAFPFVGDPRDLSAREQYFRITELVPPEDHMKLLNQMAPQWNPYDNDWNLIIDYPVYPDMYYDKTLTTLPPMTEVDATQFVEELPDRAEQDFIKSNHLYLTHKYYNSRSYPYRMPYGQQSIKINVPQRSLMRGDNDNNITYLDILNFTRNLLPNYDYIRIGKYSWDGFSAEGFPQLEVNFQFC